jgi:hypothetical protein
MDPRTRTVSAIVELPNHDHALRTGLYAEITMEGGKAAVANATPAKAKNPTKKATRSAAKD